MFESTRSPTGIQTQDERFLCANPSQLPIDNQSLRAALHLRIPQCLHCLVTELQNRVVAFKEKTEAWKFDHLRAIFSCKTCLQSQSQNFRKKLEVGSSKKICTESLKAIAELSSESLQSCFPFFVASTESLSPILISISKAAVSAGKLF